MSLSLLFRTAVSGCARRPGATATVIGMIAVALALAATSSAVGDALSSARSASLAPVADARIDLTVSALPSSTAETPAVTTIANDLVVAGRPFVRDTLLRGEYTAVPSQLAAEVRHLEGIEDTTPVLAIAVERLTGTAPERIVVPRQTVRPLTRAEHAKIEEALNADAGFQAASRELFALQEPVAAGTASASQERRFRELGQRMVDLEFGHYPERFKSFPSRTFTPGPTNARSERLVLIGADWSDGLAPLSDASVTTGQLPSQHVPGIALAQGFASRSRARVGDRFPLLGKQFTVTGIVRPPAGTVAGDVYLDRMELARLTDIGQPNVVLIRATGTRNAVEAQRRLSSSFPMLTIFEPGSVSVRVESALLASDARVGTLSRVIASVVLFGVAALAWLAVWISAARQRRDAAVLRAIGWSRARVSVLFGVESGLRTSAGAALGLALAVSVCAAMSRVLGGVNVSAVNPDGSVMNTTVLLRPQVDLREFAAITLGAVALCTVVSLAAVGRYMTRSVSRELAEFEI